MTELVPVDLNATNLAHVCPECGEEFDKPFKLGAHRRAKHGVIGATAKKGSGKRQPVQRHPLVQTARDMAADAGAGKARGAPTSEQLTHALGRGLYTVNSAVATAAVEMDDVTLPTDELKEQTLTYLTLTPGAARDVMEPIGRAFAHTPLNRRYGRAVVDNIDVVGSMAELTKLFWHWRSYFRHRALVMAQMQQGGALPMYASPAQTPAAPVVPPQNGSAPVTENGVPLANAFATPPDSRQGVVWTKDMVDAMARGRGRS